MILLRLFLVKTMDNKVFVAATNNAGKLVEIREILAEFGWECLSLKEAGIESDPEETGDSFLENATIKALAAAKKTALPVLADDSGLCVDALGGAPGVHTARYAGENATFDQNMDKLVYEMRSVPDNCRTARFCCCMVAVIDGNITSAYGECSGFVGYERLGTGGFGYNPIFYLDKGVTMATISETEKNEISHRGRALRALCRKLGEQND